jgi:cyclic pyranopterin monophosphate synthase
MDENSSSPLINMSDFTHLDKQGNVSMVDVSGKAIQQREAVASGEIRLQSETIKKIQNNEIAKGNVFVTARLAGIMAAKKTGDLIPLCHPLGLSHCEVNFEIQPDRIIIIAKARVAAQTGVEMEALTAVAIAALTIYDMCKAVDKQMEIGAVHLVSKTKK